MSITRAQVYRALFIFVVLTSLGTFYQSRRTAQIAEVQEQAKSGQITKHSIAQALDSVGSFQEFPKQVEMSFNGKPQKVELKYAFDAQLQAEMEGLFKNYR